MRHAIRAALRTMPIMHPLQPPWWSYDRHEPRLPCSHNHARGIHDPHTASITRLMHTRWTRYDRGGKGWRLLQAATAAGAAGGDGGGGAGRPPPEGIVGQAGSRAGKTPARLPSCWASSPRAPATEAAFEGGVSERIDGVPIREAADTDCVAASGISGPGRRPTMCGAWRSGTKKPMLRAAVAMAAV